jgi:GMP reductase
MKILPDDKLDFQDVLFLPKISHLQSRSEVSLETTISFTNGYTWTGIPIVAANMDTIGTFEMYKVLVTFSMITCFHKHYDVAEYPTDLNPNYYMLSTGISDKDYAKLQATLLRLPDTRFVCVDVANGYMIRFSEFIQRLRKEYPQLILVCGNVVTPDMAAVLFTSGTDIVKVGIGSGSCCTTRLQAGVGMPQLSAIMECVDAGGRIMSDGGCVFPADISKALGAGATLVMLGSMLAGHDECVGQMIEENGQKYKVFYGMSSSMAMNKYHGGVAEYRSSEGKAVKVPYRGPVKETIIHILGGIRSTCTYLGIRSLQEISEHTTFLRVHRQVNSVFG